MKNVRIEIVVTAFVHVGEGVGEGLPAEGIPFHVEEFEMRRVAPLNDSFLTTSESGNLYATVKANTVSLLAGLAGVLPEKLGHAARKFAQ
jgi:hypothetical protein